MRAKEGKPERKGERGSVLAVATLGMLAMLLAVGLGVDISRLYLTKTELQNAADASALAGASALNGSSSGITKATDRAVQAMNSYAFNKTGITFSRGNVLFAVNLEGPYMSEGAAACFRQKHSLRPGHDAGPPVQHHLRGLNPRQLAQHERDGDGRTFCAN